MAKIHKCCYIYVAICRYVGEMSRHHNSHVAKRIKRWFEARGLQRV